MKRFGLVRVVLSLGVFFFGIHEASALNVTLSGDAHVNSTHASINYGRSPICMWATGARLFSSSI